MRAKRPTVFKIMTTHYSELKMCIRDSVDTLDKAKAALSGGADVLIVGGDSFTLPLLTLKDLETLGHWVREKGKKWYIGTSRVVSEGQLSYYDQVLPRWQALSPDGIVVSNNGLVEKVLAQGLPLWVDWDQNTFKMCIRDRGHTGTAQTRFIVERARKHALDETVVRKKVDRLGNTEFSLGSLLLTCDDNVMVPMSEINEARRLSVEALTKARLEEFCPPRQKVQWHDRYLSQPVNHSLRRHAELSVHVDTLDKAKAALSGGADVLIVGGDSFTLPLLTLDVYKRQIPWSTRRERTCSKTLMPVSIS